ncbi:MAG: hypothetical protein ACR2PI_07400, partial [Hyphomicrobiaceae bacterium]
TNNRHTNREKILAKSGPVVPICRSKSATATVEERMVSQEEIARRSKLGKLVGALAIAWWVASIGGIIWVINANA